MDKQAPYSTSISKSFFFFLLSVYQSVALFSFFWQRAESTFPLRNIHVARLSRNRSVSKKKEERAMIEYPDNDDFFAKHLGPIEKTIEQLTEKINLLNKKIEGTLQGRQTDGPPTATLKVKLRTCISQIAKLLTEIDEVSSPPVKADSNPAQWEEERKKLTEKRLELEKRLNLRKNEAKEIRAEDRSTKLITKKSEPVHPVKVSKSGKQQQSQQLEDLRQIAAQVLDDDIAEEEAAFLSQLAIAGKKKFEKMMNPASKVDPRKLGRLSGSKRREREIVSTHHMWSEQANADDAGHQAKKQKSISKGTASRFPLNQWEEADEASSLSSLDAGALMSKLQILSNAKSSEESSSGESDDEEESSEEEEEPTTQPATKVSKDDLLASLFQHSTPQNALSSSSEHSSDDEVSSETEPKQEPVVKNEKKKEIVLTTDVSSSKSSKAQKTTPLPQSTTSTPPVNKSASKTPVVKAERVTSTTTKSTTKSAKTPSYPAPVEKSKSTSTTTIKKKKTEESDSGEVSNFENVASAKKTSSGRIRGTKSPMVPSAKKEAVGTTKVTDKSKGKDKEQKEKDRTRVERNISVTTDFNGGSTFDLLRKLNQFKEGAKEESSESESQPCEKSETESSEAELFDLLTCELITSYGVLEDMNKPGLIRGKKGFNLRAGSNHKRYQMEDTHYCAYPFHKFKDLALFCVFDGHAGNECATELTKVFPKLFVECWKKHNKDRKKIDISQIWVETYHEVDQQLKKYEDQGSTATTILIWRAADGKRYIQSANVGDSTAYLCREGRAMLISNDHKPTSKTERKRIEAMGITLEPDQTRLNGLAVSRAFGDHFAKSVECGITGEPYLSNAIELTAKDTRLILASDGLWDVMNGQRALEMIKSIRDPTAAAKRLLQTAVKKCNDNVTIVVVNLR